MKPLAGIFLFSLLTAGTTAEAGGPLVVEGADGHTPVRYRNPSIAINVEGGSLSNTITNATADDLVTQAFALWNTVGSATVYLQLEQNILHNVDINAGNFQNYLPNEAQGNYNDNDNLNPLVYDSNGAIIDAYLGVGQSDYTIGFAASILNLGSSYFSEGYAVINGKNLRQKLSDAELKLLIAHEIGHFLGLDHSQGDIDNRETEFGSPRVCESAASKDEYPLMYPFICRTADSLGNISLHSDDIVAISALYPSPDIDNRFGVLEGVFLDNRNQPLPGANIWAKNITTGEAFSIVSDYLKQGNGYYRLYLPAGNYTLHANSINPLFNGGSSIGPYALSINDASFRSPHPINPVSYRDDGGNEQVITIVTGQSVTVNFASDGLSAQPAVISSNATNSNSGSSGSDDRLFAVGYPLTLCLPLLLLLLRKISRRPFCRQENG